MQKNFLLDFFFPQFCCGCWRPGEFLCHSCYEQIDFLTLPIQLKLEQPSIDHVIAATAYEWPMTNLIHQMKYQHVKNIAEWCGEFLYNTTVFPKTDLITFVPLHPLRQRERGFNQSHLIAEKVARLSGVPCLPTLRKIIPSQNQVEIHDRNHRLQNVQNVFEIIKKDGVERKSVLLIDDVATTGTTLNECARILKANGAREVIGLVIAHGT